MIQVEVTAPGLVSQVVPRHHREVLQYQIQQEIQTHVTIELQVMQYITIKIMITVQQEIQTNVLEAMWNHVQQHIRVRLELIAMEKL